MSDLLGMSCADLVVGLTSYGTPHFRAFDALFDIRSKILLFDMPGAAYDSSSQSPPVTLCSHVLL